MSIREDSKDRSIGLHGAIRSSVTSGDPPREISGNECHMFGVESD
jgi:hypothetical protein